MQSAELAEQPKPYKLPSWRVQELVTDATGFLYLHDCNKKGFDVKKMVKSYGIVIKPYSAFSPENLDKLRKESLSSRIGGLALRTYYPEEEKWCCLIAYDDTNPEIDETEILLHEFSHIYLKHTQQSLHAEHEAICFTTALLTILFLEQLRNSFSNTKIARLKSAIHSQYKEVG